MVSVDQNHAFPERYVLQLGTRLGYLTVVSRVPCARVLCCVTGQEAGDSSINDIFCPIIGAKYFKAYK